ncbi:conserved Plasmodium protein, unknown function [Plasmodium gallinaceum]|uniref:Uncharacterized protein n=1 Tax=Plasmodium gallinaceum TaxID=5849 RepID=A0A1J1GRF2_PLAGA|nr:conserved Plasmodium protein, unknown function [Plasmodium gallinaceum]CRG94874.1 conserved Plasmodium protein, unknown function [Plasmodium gallinaceum]
MNNEIMKPFFPVVLNGCETISEKFFDCINKNLQPYGDEKSIENGMNQCQTLKINYEKCTEDKLKSLKGSLMFLTSYKEHKK